MNLNRIKEKYKQILQENEASSDQSEAEWQEAYSRMKNKRRKHILTESECLNRSNLTITPQNDDQKLLTVKQKLAQSLANLNKKDTQIEELKAENIKANERIRILENQVDQLKQTIHEGEQKLIDQKVSYAAIEKSMENVCRVVQSEKMDKELLQRQIEFYQTQIQQLKKVEEDKDVEIEGIKSEVQELQKYKSLNSRLRHDISRLKDLLSETEKYKIFATKIEYKNYIGKTCKEHECWVSEDIIQDVQNFIKRHKPNQSNKQFSTNLTKFLSKSIQSVKIQAQKKAKKYYKSKINDSIRKQNHSMSIMDLREQQQMKKTILSSSIAKSRRKPSLFNQSKILGQSFINGELDRSYLNCSLSKTRDVCTEILGSFRKGIIQLLEVKEIKKKKIIKLVDWAVEGIQAIFPRDSVAGEGQSLRLKTEEIKIHL